MIGEYTLNLNFIIINYSKRDCKSNILDDICFDL